MGMVAVAMLVAHNAVEVVTVAVVAFLENPAPAY